MRDLTDLFVCSSCYSGAENAEEALLSATKLNDLAPGSGAPRRYSGRLIPLTI